MVLPGSGVGELPGNCERVLIDETGELRNLLGLRHSAIATRSAGWVSWFPWSFGIQGRAGKTSFVVFGATGEGSQSNRNKAGCGRQLTPMSGWTPRT